MTVIKRRLKKALKEYANIEDSKDTLELYENVMAFKKTLEFVNTEFVRYFDADFDPHSQSFGKYQNWLTVEES